MSTIECVSWWTSYFCWRSSCSYQADGSCASVFSASAAMSMGPRSRNGTPMSKRDTSVARIVSRCASCHYRLDRSGWRRTVSPPREPFEPRAMICQKGLPVSLAPASVALCALIASALLPAGAAERAEPEPAPRHVTLDDMNRIKWPGDPQLSPDGRQVAYEVDGQLYVVATSGGEPRAVTSAGSTASQPFWSRDGAWLYFL